MTVTADTKSLLAEVLTGNRVNYMPWRRANPLSGSNRIWHHMAHMLHTALGSRTHDLLWL